MTRRLHLVLAIASRNLGRNRGRTSIAGAAIAIGVAMCIASFGVMDGMSSDMVRSITDVQLGHVQVHEPGFSSRPKLALSFDHAEQRTRAALGTPFVAAASPRVLAWALASTSERSTGVQLVGVDPKREAGLTRLSERLSRGAYLSEQATPWPAARELSEKERALDQQLTDEALRLAAREIEGLGAQGSAPSAANAGVLSDETKRLLAQVAPGPSAPLPLLLGDKLAKRLRAAPGTRVELIASDLDGNPANVACRVVGVVHTGDATLDTSRAIANIRDVQRLLGLDDRAHELAIRVNEPGRVAKVAEALARLPTFRGLDVKTWQQVRPDVVAMVQTNSAFTGMMVAIIFVVAAIGVADTILMAVFERRRELGVLKALGMRPSSIVVMIAIETLLLGVGAALAGLGLGVSIDLLLGRWGIPLGNLSSFSLAGASIPPILHASITLKGVLLPILLMVAMALLASLWPALLAARTQPVLAMKER